MKIYCPECENACSDKAPSCPQCGHPLQAMAPPHATPIQSLANAAQGGQPPIVVRPVQVVQTIEKTAKTWKLAILLATATCLLGVITCSAGISSSTTDGETSGMVAVGALLGLAGFAGVIVAKFGAWWHHG